ncbi:hypothetical protein Cfor_09359 [Coptotermes formosanus]|jgi:hypothetical protein|uniref:Ionotropic glutamate receptor L-glutamate and glycine-binding domain-containing protein n=1 Tax=Coptotermes formosanus TaxID=36987 RepID=A0A6L2QAT0_COPFO|nr:hypothetical protein Cfor_09359 [Coptotermes formosanus]
MLKTVEPHLQIQLLKTVTDRVESRLHTHILKCITTISDRYFEAGSTVVISLPSDSDFLRIEPPRETPHSEQITSHDLHFQNIKTYEATFLLRHLHGTLKWLVVTSQGSAAQHHHYKWHNYILWASDTVRKQLEFLKSFGQAWDPRGRFIVVLNKISTNPRQQARVVLKELKEAKILNVIILVPASREDHKIDIYSWFPYKSPTGKCGQIRTAILVDQWIIHKSGYFTRNASLFPIKVPRDLGKCPLTVSTFSFPPFTILGNQNSTYEGGFEIRLVEFIARTMNMSIVYIAPSSKLWGQKLENGSWTGIDSDLMLNRADVGLAGSILVQEEATHLDFTVNHGSLGFKWVVPCAKPFPRWKSITRVYSLAAWISIIITIFFAAIVFMCLARYGDQELAFYKTLTGCVLCSWAVMLGVSAGSAPVSGYMRSFFIFWVWYSLAINTLFQIFVTSYLVDPGFTKQIQSVQDVLESGVQHGFHPDLNDSLSDESDELLTKIVQHSEPCNDVEACVQRVAQRGDFVTISNHMRIEYLNTYKTLDNNGKSLVCTFGDNVIQNFKTFYLPQGSPLLYHFNRAIRVAVQAGLVDYWSESELVASRIKAASIRKISPLDDYTVFILTYLQSAFYLLFLGYGLASLVFVVELFCYNTFSHSKSRNLNLNRRLRQASCRSF